MIFVHCDRHFKVYRAAWKTIWVVVIRASDSEMTGIRASKNTYRALCKPKIPSRATCTVTPHTDPHNRHVTRGPGGRNSIDWFSGDLSLKTCKFFCLQVQQHPAVLL